MNLRRRTALGLAALILLADLGLAVSPTRYGAAFALLWILPGLAWTFLLGGRRPDIEDLLIGLGLGMGSVTLLTLVLHYFPGPTTLPALLIAINILTLSLSSLALLRPPLSNPHFQSFDFQSSLLAAVAGLFRLVHLGYSEFQGDEGVAMMRAARAITGGEAQLFYHQKGPLEVLIPLATWTLSGTINEWQARLPFAFAGLLGVVGLYLMGRRWFGKRGALAAGLLLAINGYFIGFGRIVQYQSLVLAMTTLALLALWRWSEEERPRWLLAGGALLAFGLLGHYDAVMALPAAAYVVGRGLWNERSEWRSWLPELLGAAALVAAILATFYVPFVRHPNFAKTFAYLSSDRLGAEGLLYNNLFSRLPLATFYNSIYYLAVIACLLIGAAFLSFRRRGLLIPIISVGLIVLLRSSIWVGPALASLLVAIIISRRTTAPARAAWLWFGTPFLFYYFVVWDPRTHVLNAFPGAALLTGLALNHLFEQVSSKTPHRVLTALSLAIFLFLAYHPYVMFLQHNPEIKRTWPDHRPGLYWRPDKVPRFGYFGFPYRAGWKVAGALIEDGVINGTYASNEEQEVTDWYTHGAERTYCPDPDWYFIAKNVQDEVEIPKSEVRADYHLWGKVKVEDETKLWIYHRSPLKGSPAVFQARDYALRFDTHSTPENVLPSFPRDHTPADYTLGGKVRLIGYRLDAEDARPGGSVRLVLYWKALQPLGSNYQVFNHLYDGTMWGQRDGTPGCAFRPTVLWEPGQVVRDQYKIPIEPTAPKGDIPLMIGMYNLITKERLPVRDPAGRSIGDAIPLTVVTVR